MLSSLDGLSEYDMRRPVTDCGSNLLGIVKHLAGAELVYLGDAAGRPARATLPWVEDGSVWVKSDMWATPDESTSYLVGLYRAAWRHSDESISTLDLAAAGRPGWPEEDSGPVTFGSLLIRVVALTARFAGQCEILRECIDGRVPGEPGDLGDPDWRSSYVARIQEAADTFR